MLANRVYPGLIHHKRWARNGFVPDAKFAKQLVRGLNHISAYRRKTFCTWGNIDGAISGPAAGSSTVIHRFRCHTGWAATHITFVLGIGKPVHPSTGDPRIELAATIAGGATTTEIVRVGYWSAGTNDSPSTIDKRIVKIPVDADTTYEVAVTTYDTARVLWGVAYEQASNVIDESVLYYIEDSPTLYFPIYDRMRLLLLGGLSDMWKRNGSHLLTWSTNGSTSPTFTSTTFTNVIDGSTAVAASSAGYYLGSDSQTLEPWCRISEPTEMHVVLAAHGSCAGGSTGEVRLVNGSGAQLSLTGIGSSSQWYTATTSFSDVTAFQRLDLQARVAAGGSTLTLNGVSLYAYVT